MIVIRKKNVIILLISLVGILVVIGGVLALINYVHNAQNSDATSGASNIINTGKSIEVDSSNLTAAQLNARYNAKAYEISKELQGTDPKKWTKENINKVYFLLTYYDKIGNYVSMYPLLTQLETAQGAGVAIDDNGFNRDATYRKELKERAMQDTQVMRMIGESNG